MCIGQWKMDVGHFKGLINTLSISESKETLHKPKHNKTKKKSIQNKAKKKQTAVMRKQNPSSNTSIKLISFP